MACISDHSAKTLLLLRLEERRTDNDGKEKATSRVPTMVTTNKRHFFFGGDGWNDTYVRRDGIDGERYVACSLVNIAADSPAFEKGGTSNILLLVSVPMRARVRRCELIKEKKQEVQSS